MKKNILVISRVKGLLEHISTHIISASKNDLKSFKVFSIDSSNINIAGDLHADIDVIVADPNHEYLLKNIDSKFPNLKFLQSTFAGNNALISGSKRRNYICSKIGSGFAPQMSEYVFAHALMHSTCCIRSELLQRNNEWRPEAFMSKQSLSGRVLGVMGVGDIGENIAKTGKYFGMSTIGLCRTSREVFVKDIQSRGGAGNEKPSVFDNLTISVDDILRNSDVIVNCLPSTPKTKYLLNKRNLTVNLYNRPRSPPLFINIGRGDVISESDVLFALQTKLFGHAVLDVFEKEPLPQSSALWNHPQVTITPHISAMSTLDIVSNVLSQNLNRYMNGEEILYKVDFDKGY